jgi:type II secretory ATPase GspE/PulE/Tfp pilus assembly ATPase PilB-like protein
MVAGTFNLVMAQRLSRKVCTLCRHQISVKDTQQRLDAREAFSTMDKEELKKEIVKRGITQEQRLQFINEGLVWQ